MTESLKAPNNAIMNKLLTEQRTYSNKSCPLNISDKDQRNAENLDYEETIERAIERMLPAAGFPENFHQWSLDEQCQWFESLDGIRDIVPENLIATFAASYRVGDCGSSPLEKPQWFDMNKFRRGQKFAREYLFGIAYAEILCLFLLYTFKEDSRPLILSGKSSTPYLSFKRYLSTLNRVKNWYSEDPWVEGSSAQKDILAVRAMHQAMNQNLRKLDEETLDNMSTIKNPWCPALDTLLKDFKTNVPVTGPGQCPYLVIKKFPVKIKEISQAAMSSTQFAFIGYVILFPKYFGIHKATSEDLDAFCHLWRCIGYLLGIEDECNFCRGSLEEVKQRSREFIEFWVKPNFRNITSDWEHITRCVAEGISYYAPFFTYEVAVLHLTDCLNINLSNLRASLTYSQWIKMHVIRFVFKYLCQFQSVIKFLNAKFNLIINRAMEYTDEKDAQLQERSAKTLSLYVDKFHNSHSPFNT